MYAKALGKQWRRAHELGPKEPMAKGYKLCSNLGKCRPFFGGTSPPLPPLPKVMTLRPLLIQARVAGDPILEHELACFAQRAGLEPEAFKTLNLPVDSWDEGWLEGAGRRLCGRLGRFFRSSQAVLSGTKSCWG